MHVPSHLRLSYEQSPLEMSAPIEPSPKPAAAVAPLPTSINFATAGLGGILGWVVVHPFNT